MLYTLDANILINLGRLYPREFFTSLWENIAAAARAGTIDLCEAVYNEINDGDDDLGSWAGSIPGFVQPTIAEELNIVASIAQAHPDWVQGKKNYGDPFLIAHAKVTGLTIVTEEKSAGAGTIDKNQKVPNIATEHGVRCIRFFDLLREQGWNF